MESNENRLNVKFAYCKDTEEIVFENGNKVPLKDLVSDYLLQKDATTKENLTVEQIKWERDIAIEQLKELGYGLGEKIRTDEDCISRAEAQKHIYTRLYESALNNVGYKCKASDVFTDIAENRLNTWISEIPSIQPKTGHWIADVDRWGDVVTTVNGYRCSKCGEFYADKDNYCPNCGADMRGE